MVVVVQLVRTPDCGSGGRGFESHLPPQKALIEMGAFFVGYGAWANSLSRAWLIQYFAIQPIFFEMPINLQLQTYLGSF